MQFLASTLSIFGMLTLAVAAPASADEPPSLTALFQELRDFRCETGGLNTRAILSTEAGKCLKFKNPLDTSGVKLTFLKPECYLLVHLDDNCQELAVNVTRGPYCLGDDVRTYGSAIVGC
ncbi:hypothetical protein BU24DRAFT_457935 [Aaosphaeria arxii CBS 175.79]|uniref:Cyanovirin-N domain-containing protein n=1 Tax=Aaosphaeria arxii CBS 175.79 TaxID=1450172 RepID=A0A6A5YAH7_9PLEO|nr:uncharacterized protein BU24DRAFT_457935 [Aaosphaeria arxii CBS 175.79]KAF2022027.1 hypothetical protein BU24DRAFT_457935 [Aaosphaeria arxii CBS 175.79]